MSFITILLQSAAEVDPILYQGTMQNISNGSDYAWLWMVLSSSITAFASSLITYIFTRKQYKAQIEQIQVGVKQTELDNVEKAITIWRNMAENLNSKLDEQSKELSAIKGYVKLLESKVDTYENDIHDLKCQLDKHISKTNLKATKEENTKNIKSIKQQV